MSGCFNNKCGSEYFCCRQDVRYGGTCCSIGSQICHSSNTTNVGNYCTNVESAHSQNKSSNEHIPVIIGLVVAIFVVLVCITFLTRKGYIKFDESGIPYLEFPSASVLPLDDDLPPEPESEPDVEAPAETVPSVLETQSFDEMEEARYERENDASIGMLPLHLQHLLGTNHPLAQVPPPRKPPPLTPAVPSNFVIPGDLQEQLDRDRAQIRNFYREDFQQDVELRPTVRVIQLSAHAQLQLRLERDRQHIRDLYAADFELDRQREQQEREQRHLLREQEAERELNGEGSDADVTHRNPETTLITPVAQPTTTNPITNNTIRRLLGHKRINKPHKIMPIATEVEVSAEAEVEFIEYATIVSQTTAINVTPLFNDERLLNQQRDLLPGLAPMFVTPLRDDQFLNQGGSIVTSAIGAPQPDRTIFPLVA